VGSYFSKVTDMSLKAAKEADIILYIVDGKILPQDEDKNCFIIYKNLNKPYSPNYNRIVNG